MNIKYLTPFIGVDRQGRQPIDKHRQTGQGGSLSTPCLPPCLPPLSTPTKERKYLYINILYIYFIPCLPVYPFLLRP